MESIIATYRDGVLTPVEPLDLPEGSKVTLWISPSGDLRNDLTDGDRQSFEQLAQDRNAVFRKLQT
jgi:predicted DNA-binding antitoxin AbrB/MazE fold protein